MANLPSVLLKMTDVEIAPDAPESEALNAKIGENINALIDENAARLAETTSLQSQVSAIDPLSFVHVGTLAVVGTDLIMMGVNGSGFFISNASGSRFLQLGTDKYVFSSSAGNLEVYKLI